MVNGYHTRTRSGLITSDSGFNFSDQIGTLEVFKVDGYNEGKRRAREGQVQLEKYFSGNCRPTAGRQVTPAYLGRQVFSTHQYLAPALNPFWGAAPA